MQKTHNIFLKAALSLLVIFSAAGCITDKFDASSGLQSVILQVKIATGEMTKATPTESESVINSVRIYAYRTDGTQVGHFFRASASGESILMDLVLPETGVHNVDFVVIVNEASISFMDDFAFSEEMTQSELSGAKIHNINPTYGFPMYCLQTESINVDNVSGDANTAQGHEGHMLLTQQVEFGLVRPMAKISVYGAIVEGGSSGSIIIRNVGFSVNGTRNYNYLFPQDESVLATVPLRTNGRDMISQDVTLTKTIDKTDAATVNNPDNYDLIVADQYLGEVEVGDKDWSTKESDRQAVLHIEYSVGAGSELQHGYVYLPAIVRNTHYKVCMRINSEGNIMINYVVADWDDADVTNLVFDYPTHTYLRVATNESDSPSAPAEMSVSQPFVGYFKLSAPVNEEWTPVLLNSATECDVAVYKVGETTPSSTPISASDDWYKIEVTPHSSLPVGTEVEFAITYSPDYSTSVYEYLMINGSQNNYHWPYGGTSVEDPNKVIITVK